jgi:hypothetical protein
MPRARISSNGPQIAKPGFDVDTASFRDMVFDPRFVAARVMMTGTVTTTDYTGFMDQWYTRAIVPYGRTLPMPAIALFFQHYGDGRLVSHTYVREFPPGNDWAKMFPDTEVRAYTDRAEIYAATKLATRPAGNTFTYVILENTLANS